MHKLVMVLLVTTAPVPTLNVSHLATCAYVPVWRVQDLCVCHELPCFCCASTTTFWSSQRHLSLVIGLWLSHSSGFPHMITPCLHSIYAADRISANSMMQLPKFLELNRWLPFCFPGCDECHFAFASLVVMNTTLIHWLSPAYSWLGSQGTLALDTKEDVVQNSICYSYHTIMHGEW